MKDQLTISIGRLKPIIKSASLKRGKPVLALSAPGLGKSASIKQAAEEWAEEQGMKFWDSSTGERPTDKHLGYHETIWSQHDPTDLKFPALIEGRMVQSYSTELPLEGNEDKFPPQGLWSSDEITNVEPFMGKCLMQLVLDKKIGTKRVLPGWKLVGAGNRIQDRSYANILTPTLASRFCVLQVEPNLDDWVKWALTKGQMHPLVIAFLRFRPNLLHHFDYKVYSGGEYAFPCPRQWESVGAFVDETDGDLRAPILAGLVGSAAAYEFEGFARVWQKLPDLDAILSGKPAKVPTDTQTLYATVTALVVRASDKNLGNVFEYVKKLGGEWQSLFSKDLIRKNAMFAIHEAYNAWCATGGNNFA